MSWENVPQETKGQWQSIYTSLPKQDISWDNIELFYYLIETEDEDVSTVFTKEANRKIIQPLVKWIARYKNQAQQQQAAQQPQQQALTPVAEYLSSVSSSFHHFEGAVFGYEGIYVRAPTTVLRTDFIQNLIDYVRQNGRLLLRAPPASGKTAILDLLESHLKKIGKLVYRMKFSLRTDPRETIKSATNVAIDDFIHKFPQEKFPQVWLLMDECHLHYDKRELWSGMIKGQNNIYIVYAATTKLEFLITSPFKDHIWSFRELKFSSNEQEELWERVITNQEIRAKLKFIEDEENKTNDMKDDISLVEKTIKQFVLEQSGGHPGAIVMYLQHIKNLLKNNGSNPISTEQLLIEIQMYDPIKFDRIWAEANLGISDTQKLLLQKFLLGIAGKDEQEKTEIASLVDLLRLACLIKEEDEIQKEMTNVNDSINYLHFFTFPLARQRFMRYFFPTRGTYKPMSVHDLVTQSVGYFSQKLLIDCMSGNFDPKKGVKESCIQQMFYFVCNQFLDSSLMLVPEKGIKDKNEKGQVVTYALDFYINSSFQYGIEIMRSGEKLLEHISRFLDGGKYTSLGLRHWVVVDYYMESLYETQFNNSIYTIISTFAQYAYEILSDHYIIIIFSKDFSSAEIRTYRLTDDRAYTVNSSLKKKITP